MQDLLADLPPRPRSKIALLEEEILSDITVECDDSTFTKGSSCLPGIIMKAKESSFSFIVLEVMFFAYLYSYLLHDGATTWMTCQRQSSAVRDYFYSSSGLRSQNRSSMNACPLQSTADIHPPLVPCIFCPNEESNCLYLLRFRHASRSDAKPAI
ncbi:hypothetical protein OE88DRAFT_1512750 [Heliocybe sulcata]|uniref:Uncharacterized protein n=1 Tax=Heliocybe sulcata TaxID=5364 RepID=A0A5C3NBF6_9AGAM|nr:hypothetical protein OE88DRAFT_1512750 [Heliocybe sulcata]